MNDVAVYRNRNSRCCILINEDKKFVQYISTEEDSGEINTDIRKMEAREFHTEYNELETYPVLRAVEHYQNPLTAAIRITDRAAKCLRQLRTDKGIAMQDQNRRTLAERNVIATHKAGLPKTGPVPPVAPCEVIEVIPGSSKKPKRGTWDMKVSPTEENNDVQRVVVRKFKTEKAKAEKKAARLEQRKKRMTEQTENNNVNNEQQNDEAPQSEAKAAKKPAAKKAPAKKAEPKTAAKAASKKPATKEASKTTKTTKEKTVTKKTDTAKKTTAKKTAKAPAKAPAKANKLAKGTGKKAAAASKAPAKKAGKTAPQEGARRGRKGAFDEGQKIKLLTKDNPKREGTAAYDTFEQLRKSKTVGDFFAAGGSSASLHWNIERGYIEVV